MTWPVCFVVEMRDGKVATFTFYADILTLISQLGAVPGPRPA
jgi:ketosteroid isomerase-like protein